MIHNNSILFDDINTGRGQGVLRLRKRTPVIKKYIDLLEGG